MANRGVVKRGVASKGVVNRGKAWRGLICMGVILRRAWKALAYWHLDSKGVACEDLVCEAVASGRDLVCKGMASGRVLACKGMAKEGKHAQ